MAASATPTPQATAQVLPKSTGGKPTKPKVSGGLGISLTALNEEKEEEVVKRVADQEDMSEHFSPIQLINEWKGYANELIEEHHLKNTMLSCLPDLIENTLFEVVVNNPMQEDRLVEYQIEILSRLRSKLRNTRIRMQIRISEDNEKKLAFTPTEKFNVMMEENEALRRLKDEFGLELM